MRSSIKKLGLGVFLLFVFFAASNAAAVEPVDHSTAATAMALDLNTEYTLDLVACEEDWFEFTLPNFVETVTIDLVPIEDYDLDGYVYYNDDTIDSIASGIAGGSGDAESITITYPVAGVYYIKALEYSFFCDTDYTYTIEISTVSYPDNGIANYYPGIFDTSADAQELEAGTYNLVLDSDVEDWFFVTLGDSVSKMTVTLTPEVGYDLDLKGYKADDTTTYDEISNDIDVTGQPEVIEVTSPAAGILSRS